MTQISTFLMTQMIRIGPTDTQHTCSKETNLHNDQTMAIRLDDEFKFNCGKMFSFFNFYRNLGMETNFGVKTKYFRNEQNV